VKPEKVYPWEVNNLEKEKVRFLSVPEEIRKKATKKVTAQGIATGTKGDVSATAFGEVLLPKMKEKGMKEDYEVMDYVVEFLEKVAEYKWKVKITANVKKKEY